MTDEGTAFVSTGSCAQILNRTHTGGRDASKDRRTCGTVGTRDWMGTPFAGNKPAIKSGRASVRMGIQGGSKSRSESGNQDDMSADERRRIEGVRARLEGLFGVENNDSFYVRSDKFDGSALRQAILDRWGVQYDVQPQKRHGRVYLQIMWRYFGQQSFYMDEEEFASHCEAVAILLKRWKAVDYFLDYITTIKKRRTLLLKHFKMKFS